MPQRFKDPMTLHTSSTALAATALLLAANSVAAERGYSPDREALNSVILQLQHKDCPAAISALNKGIKSQQPDLLLLAGSMYEHGLCLKPNWIAAEGYYLQANQAGNPGAIDKLIAGYARDNRDPAAAMYWNALSGRDSLPSACLFKPGLAQDPDKFVAELQGWKPERIAACVYVAGVTAQVRAELEFPQELVDRGMSGELHGNFNPATATFTWKTEHTSEMVTTRTVAFEESTKRMKGILLKHANTISDRALLNYKQPPGIDPAWNAPITFTYRTTWK